MLPAGHEGAMIFALLSRRVRAWVAFALVLPLIGRVLQALGVRVSERNPRVGKALTTAGGVALTPRRRRRSRVSRQGS